MPARKRGAFDLGMRTEVPVWGFRPVRAARSTLSNVPKPVIETFPPRTTSRTMVSSTASRASLAALRLPSRFSSSLTRSALFTVDQLQLVTASGWDPDSGVVAGGHRP